ncbi:MAG: DsbE family thiol:disulfide interchange protein, partial [Pseudohongiellaceae bacterium]
QAESCCRAGRQRETGSSFTGYGVFMNNRVKLFIPAVFFLVMLGLLLFGLGRDPNQVPSALVFRPVPEFSRPDLLDAMLEHSSQDLQGEIFLVNFWASWCAPCYIEHPYLMELSERDDITLVGVSYKDEKADAMEFLEDLGNPFDYVIVDADGSLGIDFGVAGAPETFVVDRNGVIRYRHVSVIDDRVWENTFQPIIAEIR